MFVLLLSSVLIFIPEESEAVGNPRVTVSLDQSSQEAQVAPGQSGLVTFTGLVRCTSPVDTQFQQVLVSLQADAGGWAWSITPSSLSFDKATSELPFSCTVRVPPRTSHTQTGQVTISGTYRVQPGAFGSSIPGPATGMITIEQFYKFSVECPKPYIEVQPGSQLVYQLKLKNEGNDQDTLKVEVEDENFKKLVNNNWAIQLSSDKFTINENEEAIVKLTVNTPMEWHIIWYNVVTTIRLKVYSSQAMELGEMSMGTEYPVYVRERGVSAPGFEAPILMMSLLFLLMLIKVVMPENRLNRKR